MPLPTQFTIGWEPPGPALLWDSVGFRGTRKRKALSLPADSIYNHRTLCFFFPGRVGDSPVLNKALLLHSIHMLCLDFSIWGTQTKIC
jgi:hypothetical protein